MCETERYQYVNIEGIEGVRILHIGRIQISIQEYSRRRVCFCKSHKINKKGIFRKELTEMNEG